MKLTNGWMAVIGLTLAGGLFWFTLKKDKKK